MNVAPAEDHQVVVPVSQSVTSDQRRLAYLRSLATEEPPAPAEFIVDFSLESVLFFSNHCDLHRELSANSSKQVNVDRSRPNYDGRKRKLLARSLDRVSYLRLD